VVQQLASAQCEKLFECCSDDELQTVFGMLDASDPDACREALRSQAEAFLQPALERSIASDAVQLDDDALDRCVTALQARSCAQFEPSASVDVLSVQGCTDVVQPKLTLSAFCAEDFECQTGFCSRPPAESQGACKNPPAVGEPCLNERCGPGLYCGDDDLCAEKLGVGQICTRNAECRGDNCSPGDDGEFVCAEVSDICSG
jgi:hypothetical protein